MMKKRINSILAAVLVLCMLTGCVNVNINKGDSDSEDTKIEESVTKKEPEKEKKKTEEKDKPKSFSSKFARPTLVMKELNIDEGTVKADTQDYEVAPDLSNVYNLNQLYLHDEMIEKLAENMFVVEGYAGDEFFELYEFNRYDYIPSFVTVDSLMHTYHLYFSYLLKKIEKNNISEALYKLSQNMVSDSISQYEALKGSEWEDAAIRNVAFFTVGAKLLDYGFKEEDFVEGIVEEELEKIYDADSVVISQVTGYEEDYTQYKPRGYYDGDEQLEKYFRAMMWYGRIHFKQDIEDLDRSALLITKALTENEQSYSIWDAIYALTSFFAGASDDAGMCEYAPVLFDAYGENASDSDLIGNKEAFKKYHTATKNIKVPEINSIPVMDTAETNIIPGFRFMGQRFTIDASVMQKLVYRAVDENEYGDRRMLPDVLDFPAALGSDTALEILTESGKTDYPNYMENMDKLRKALSEDNDKLWSASLYASWLHTLRPLLNEDRDGFPQFMRSKEWAKKNLECFAGSYTELKHDTVLYSKQLLAEMGDGDVDTWDDRGYVEPEPLVYTRFVNLATQTKEGLKRYNMTDDNIEDDLNKLIEIAKTLKTISEKELRNELPTEDEFEFIRCYGGYIEHFWYEIASEDKQDQYVSTQEYPAALVTDIATDPNGTVLELGTESPSGIFVIVKVDDKIKIARGTVYSFYQFDWPMEDRLTDGKWWRILGINWDPYADGEEEDYTQYKPEKPYWTDSYRYVYRWYD